MTSNGKGNLMSDTLKAAARAGDPKALEALMNKSFGSRGITVRVTNSGSLLRVLLRGTEAPDRALLPLIQKGLGSIKPAGFEKVVVSARAIGKGDVWTETWQLAPGNAAAKSLSANNTKTPKPVVKTLLSSQQTTQWYQKTWLVVTMLVLFPFAGVPLAWLAQWSKPAKIVSSSIGSLWILILLFNGGTDVETASEPVPVDPPRETVAPTQQVVETDAPPPQPVALPLQSTNSSADKSPVDEPASAEVNADLVAVPYTVIDSDSNVIHGHKRIEVWIIAPLAKTFEQRGETVILAAQELQVAENADVVAVALEPSAALAGQGSALALARYAPDGKGYGAQDWTWEVSSSRYPIDPQQLRIAEAWLEQKGSFQVDDGFGGTKTDDDALSKAIAKDFGISPDDAKIFSFLGLYFEREDYPIP